MVLGIMFLSMACGSEHSNTVPKAHKSSNTFDSKVPVVLENKGVGPIESISIPDTINRSMARMGNDLFNKKCSMCHKTSQKYIGPSLFGVTKRRSPEWIMNMIMVPNLMVQKDSIAKMLLLEYNGAPMAQLGINESDARSLLEYLRTLNKD